MCIEKKPSSAKRTTAALTKTYKLAAHEERGDGLIVPCAVGVREHDVATLEREQLDGASALRALEQRHVPAISGK